MLPGKQYTVDDYLQAAWVRRWVILLPAILIAGGTAIAAMYLPNTYRASTTILIVPPRVPTDYVRPAVTTQIEDRLQMISQQILSRTRLERIIQEFNLYKRERQTMIMEDVIEQMRRDVHVDVINQRADRNDTRAFTIGFDSQDPRTAMRVTERLASLYIQENLEEREVLSTSTNQFLDTQLADARARLIEHEKKLEQFRERNDGQLPSQVESNLQMMRTAQTQLQAVLDSENRDHDRLLMLQRSLADAESLEAAGAPVSTGAGVPSVAGQLAAARENLRQLQLRLKPQHPDVLRAQRLVAELEKKAQAEQPLSPDVTLTPSERNAQNRIGDLKAEIDQLQHRLEAGRAEEARLRTVLASYKEHVERAPALESELTELMRDYSTLQDTYTSLLRKSEDAKVSANLERREIGEQFRILDPARLPEKPISPNRPRIDAVGVLAGLAVGVGLALLLEYRDTTFKSDTDVVASLALPVLAVVPAMVTVEERRLAARRRLLAWCASACTLLVAAVVAVWKLRLLDGWGR